MTNLRQSGRGLAALVLAAACRQDAKAPASDLAVTDLPTPTASAPAAADAMPVRVPETGALVMTWLARDADGWRLFFSRSADAGATWASPVPVTPDAGDATPQSEGSPRLVAATGGRLAVVWPRAVTVPGRQWPATIIRAARSLDGGRTWEPPRTLNDDTTGAAGTHTFHGAAWAGDSGLVAAWLDERAGPPTGHSRPLPQTSGEPTSEPDVRIYAAVSRDFGATWAPNAAVWGAVCPCCRVSLARAPGGGVVAAWRQHFPGNIRDIVTARLDPAPADPALVHADNWSYPGCPHTGPAIAVDSAGAQHVAWYTGKQGGSGVYYARVGGTDSLGAAVGLAVAGSMQTAHPAIVALPGGGALVAFDVGADGGREIRLARVGADRTVRDTLTVAGSAGGRNPQLALAGDGAAVIAWTAPGGAGEDGTVRLARISLAR